MAVKRHWQVPMHLATLGTRAVNCGLFEPKWATRRDSKRLTSEDIRPLGLSTKGGHFLNFVHLCLFQLHFLSMRSDKAFRLSFPGSTGKSGNRIPEKFRNIVNVFSVIFFSRGFFVIFSFHFFSVFVEIFFSTGCDKSFRWQGIGLL